MTKMINASLRSHRMSPPEIQEMRVERIKLGQAILDGKDSEAVPQDRIT